MPVTLPSFVPLLSVAYRPGEDALQFELQAEIFADVAGWGVVLADVLNTITQLELARSARPGNVQAEEVRQRILVAMARRLAEYSTEADLPAVGEA